ncbi:pogo transposable [Alternaria alternata]|nr:pogo transposable [Alternaria alternata]
MDYAVSLRMRFWRCTAARSYLPGHLRGSIKLALEWSNNELGLAWLQQVFERHTAAKARRQWRLLILDGHGSHVTPEFLEFCEAKRIIVMVYPPHLTHSLQPLDVVLFGPLSSHYTKQLT